MRKAMAVFAALLVIAAGITLIPRIINDYKFNMLQQSLLKERYVIHAGGVLYDSDGNEYTYTNTKEALLNCKQEGHRFIELDFMKTSDGYWVCAHDDDSGEKWAKGYDFVNVPSLFEFCNSKYDRVFTPLTIDELAEFLHTNDDYYIITDVKDINEEACDYIRKFFPDIMNNFIIQIYHIDEYELIRDMGYKYIIYTLYRATMSELIPDNLIKAAKEHKLFAITFWYYYTDDDSFMEKMISTKVPLLVHTVNDKEEMREYIHKGVAGIYTDIVDAQGLYYD